ncbi:hypothetical protein D3C72_1624460 [compost metagenome]
MNVMVAFDKSNFGSGLAQILEGFHQRNKFFCVVGAATNPQIKDIPEHKEMQLFGISFEQRTQKAQQDFPIALFSCFQVNVGNKPSFHYLSFRSKPCFFLIKAGTSKF